MIRIAVAFNICTMILNIGFAVIVPIIDVSNIYASDDCLEFPLDSSVCMSFDGYNLVQSADIGKIVTGAIAIKFTVIYAGYMINLLRNKRRHALSANYVYAQANQRNMYPNIQPNIQPVMVNRIQPQQQPHPQQQLYPEQQLYPQQQPHPQP